jgi:hypothetical protein
MSQKILIILAICGGVLAPALIASADPVMNVANHPITNLKKFSLDQVKMGIIAGGTKYKWMFHDDGPGRLRASQDEGRLHAVIAITYTENTYSITLLESQGLEQKGDQIRSRYNRWMTLLTRNIDNELQKLAIGPA